MGRTSGRGTAWGAFGDRGGGGAVCAASFGVYVSAWLVSDRAEGAKFREMARRVLGTGIVSSLLILLIAAAPAGAHLRSGTVAVDYLANVLRPGTDAYSAQIFQSDRALSVTVRPGHSVVLLGYLGEPVFRLTSAGLWLNAKSPTAAALRLIKKAEGDSSSAPRWLGQRGRHSVIWHDSRSQGLPPGVSRGLWSVPLIVDGRPVRLEGELRRFPAPSPWLWLGILAFILTAGVLPFVPRRHDLAGPASVWFGVIAACACGVLLVAFALDAYASPGTWIEAVDAIAFIGVGVWALLRAPRQWHVAAAIGLGLVSLAVGLLEGAVFLHPVVLAILPGTATRLADVLAVGAGVLAAGLGGLAYFEQGGVLPASATVGVPIPRSGSRP